LGPFFSRGIFAVRASIWARFASVAVPIPQGHASRLAGTGAACADNRARRGGGLERSKVVLLLSAKRVAHVPGRPPTPAGLGAILAAPRGQPRRAAAHPVRRANRAGVARRPARLTPPEFGDGVFVPYFGRNAVARPPRRPPDTAAGAGGNSPSGRAHAARARRAGWRGRSSPRRAGTAWHNGAPNRPVRRSLGRLSFLIPSGRSAAAFSERVIRSGWRSASEDVFRQARAHGVPVAALFTFITVKRRCCTITGGTV
jgi:hypothetical protein